VAALDVLIMIMAVLMMGAGITAVIQTRIRILVLLTVLVAARTGILQA